MLGFILPLHLSLPCNQSWRELPPPIQGRLQGKKKKLRTLALALATITMTHRCRAMMETLYVGVLWFHTNKLTICGKKKEIYIDVCIYIFFYTTVKGLGFGKL